MEIALNLETLQQCCRGCLQKGDINIWNFKVKMHQENSENLEHMGDSMDLYIFKIMEIFNKEKNEILDLTEEFPLLCWQCLEDLKFCYIFYEKLKLANIQLKKLYTGTINQYIEEEHLIEPIEEYEEITEEVEIIETPPGDNSEKPKIQSIEIITPSQHVEELQTLPTEPSKEKPIAYNYNKKVPFDKNSAFVITQFIPSALETPQKNCQDQAKQQEVEEGFTPPAQHILTMDYKLVEVKDIKNLETSSTLATNDIEPAVYICQYCPKAYAKSEYLQTHIQKCHVCKFCTQPFSVTEDLFKHIRELHTEHKCVICQKNLSSNTNLRQHIRRVHRINLPAKVALIDYIKSTDIAIDNIQNVNEVEISQEDNVEVINENIQYLWKNDDDIEILSENNGENN